MEGVIQNDQYFNIGRLCDFEKTDVFSAQCPSKTGLENQFLSVKARLSFGIEFVQVEACAKPRALNPRSFLLLVGLILFAVVLL